MEKPKNPEDIELAVNDSDGKNWRGILIALLVIVIICGLVIVAVVLVTPRFEEKELGEPFTLHDLFSHNFTVRKFTGTWIRRTNYNNNNNNNHNDDDNSNNNDDDNNNSNNNNHDDDFLVFRAPNGDLMQLDPRKNETSVILDSSVFQMRNAEWFSVSADLRFILLAYEVEQVYRHSFLAKYEIYDRFPSANNGPWLEFPASDSDKWKNEKLQFAGWSSRGRSLTFVYGNNLYFQAHPHTTASWVTVPDKKNSKYILNGVPDWLYEEEILRSNVAHWLAPGNEFIAYIQFNDTDVPVHRFPVYGDASDIYGSISEVSYPKAGDSNPNINPNVTLLVAKIGKPKDAHRVLNPPPRFRHKDHYITHVQWRDDEHILVAWSNRAQNFTSINICKVSSAECAENLIERQHDGWVNLDSIRFIRQGDEPKYLTVLSQQIADMGYWKHVASVSAEMHSTETKSFLTSGDWEVTSLVGYNEEESTVYFIRSNDDARQRHLYSLKLSPDGRRSVGYPKCMTCSLGSQCLYVEARFSQSGRYYIEECLGPGVPYYTLKSTTNNDTAIVLEDNALLRANLARKALPKKEQFRVETEDGAVLEGQIMLPPILNKDHITLYPLLIHTYAGPDTQLVTEKFTLDWSTYLSSTENVIYASIDGRGSSGRGNRFLHEIYRRLGTVEVQDQIEGAGHLSKELKFVDKDRIAIWGWSYGGFVVSHVLGDREDTVFRCGIAIAPVTDWRYYDTAYTERYMGMASSNDNYRGYDNANVSSKAAHFKGKGFLLIHGTADDNVHFQHSAQLMKALTEAGVLFQTQVYADKQHQLPGDRTTRHLYRTMTKFLQKECWAGGKPQEAKPVAAETNQKQKGKS